MLALLLEQFEKGLNRYLALDPESQKRLAKLEGKAVTIGLKPFQLTFQIIIQNQKVSVSLNEDHPADIKISGTPLSLLSLACTSDKKHRFFSDDIIIEGNTEHGQAITDLFDQLDIDWEEYASRLLGDGPAHELGKIARRFSRWGKHLKNTLLKNTDEYVHEEKQWFPPEEELKDFFNEVDDTRMAVDRLAAHIKNWDE